MKEGRRLIRTASIRVTEAHCAALVRSSQDNGRDDEATGSDYEHAAESPAFVLSPSPPSYS